MNLVYGFFISEFRAELFSPEEAPFCAQHTITEQNSYS